MSWKSSAMDAYLSRCQRAMSALLISGSDYSLLPTAVASTGDYNQGGGGGRRGPKRYGLQGLARKGQLPTVCTRDEKGPGPPHTKGGRDLSSEVGGHLNPEWVAWFMGFPLDWLEVNDDAEFVRSVMRSYLNAPK